MYILVVMVYPTTVNAPNLVYNKCLEKLGKKIIIITPTESPS